MNKLTNLKAQSLFEKGTIELFDTAGKWIGKVRHGEGIPQTLFDLPEPTKKELPPQVKETINPNQIALF